MPGVYRRKAGYGPHFFRERDGKEREKPILAGEEIECEEWELGGSIHGFDVVVPPPPPPAPNVGLKRVHRGGGRFDVVNEATGKPINSRTLTREEADDLIADAPAAEIDEEDDAAQDAAEI